MYFFFSFQGCLLFPLFLLCELPLDHALPLDVNVKMFFLVRVQSFLFPMCFPGGWSREHKANHTLCLLVSWYEYMVTRLVLLLTHFQKVSSVQFFCSLWFAVTYDIPWSSLCSVSLSSNYKCIPHVSHNCLCFWHSCLELGHSYSCLHLNMYVYILLL